MKIRGTRTRNLALALALAVSVPALAYVPNSPTIVRRFAVAAASTGAASSPLFGSARLGAESQALPARVDLSAHGCRVELTTAQGASSVSFARGTVTPSGTPIPALEALVALGCPLLAMSDLPVDEIEKSVLKLAHEWSIDFSSSALSRTEGRVGAIVGTTRRDPSRPQIWFDYVTNRPLRVMASYGGQFWDIRFLDPASLATNRSAPRVATVWLGAARQLELHLMAETPKAPGEEAAPALQDEESD